MFDPTGLFGSYGGSEAYDEYVVKQGSTPQAVTQQRLFLGTLVLLTPGPEDALLAGVAATKLGQAALRTGGKYLDEVGKAVGEKVDDVVSKVAEKVFDATGGSKTKTNMSPESARNVSEAIDEAPNTVDVFHKGNLDNPNKGSLSTGTDKDAVSALDRDGPVNEFNIPVDEFKKMDAKGDVKTVKDHDLETGVQNDEVRFEGDSAKKVVDEFKKEEKS